MYTIAVKQIIQPISVVLLIWYTLIEDVSAFPMVLIIFEFSYILIAILMNFMSSSILFIICPFSIILFYIRCLGINLLASSMPVTAFKGTFIYRTIKIGLLKEPKRLASLRLINYRFHLVIDYFKLFRKILKVI